MPTIVTDEDDYPIQPSHITLSGHMHGAFGHMETEVSARYIIRLCQRNGTWKPFSREEIEVFYNEAGHKEFYFNHLIGSFSTTTGLHSSRTDHLDVIVFLRGDGLYCVTDEFINRCFESSRRCAANQTK